MVGLIWGLRESITGLMAQHWPGGTFNPKRVRARPERINVRTERLTEDFGGPRTGLKWQPRA